MFAIEVDYFAAKYRAKYGSTVSIMKTFTLYCIVLLLASPFATAESADPAVDQVR